jgi:hypothetical protein
MLKLDNNLLQELGLGGLPEDQKKGMLQHIYETLELRVGTQLANQMTDQQLEEFEQFIDEGGDGNQAQALQWLETNLPNYKQVVNEVFEALKAEIKQMAPQIMASSQAAPQPPQMPQQAQPTAPTQQAPSAAQPVFPSTPDAATPAMQQPAPVDYQPPVPAQGPQPSYPQQPQMPQTPPGQPAQDAQTYQFPQQQPPADPGAGQPPQAA